MYGRCSKATHAQDTATHERKRWAPIKAHQEHGNALHPLSSGKRRCPAFSKMGAHCVGSDMFERKSIATVPAEPPDQPAALEILGVVLEAGERREARLIRWTSLRGQERPLALDAPGARTHNSKP